MSTLSLLVGLLLDDSAEEAQSRYGHVTHKGVQEERPVTAVLPTPQRHSPVDRYVTRAGHGGTPARHQQLRHACRSRGHPRTSSTRAGHGGIPARHQQLRHARRSRRHPRTPSTATSRMPLTSASPRVINIYVTRAGHGGIPARHQQPRHACRSRWHPRASSTAASCVPVKAVSPRVINSYATRASHGGIPARHQQLRHACRSRRHPRTSSTAASRVPVKAVSPRVINSYATRAGHGGIPAPHPRISSTAASSVPVYIIITFSQMQKRQWHHTINASRRDNTRMTVFIVESTLTDHGLRSINKRKSVLLYHSDES